MKNCNTLGYNVNEDIHIDCQFNMNIPQNESEIIDNIVNATGAGVMSVKEERSKSIYNRCK